MHRGGKGTDREGERKDKTADFWQTTLKYQSQIQQKVLSSKSRKQQIGKLSLQYGFTRIIFCCCMPHNQELDLATMPKI
jgi:hypothetical protein